MPQLITGAIFALTMHTSHAQELTLLTLDPGHFHAALFQRTQLPGIAEEALVYAPLGPDLTAHLDRVAQYGARRDHPTRWRLRVYAGPDFLERMLAERRGQIVVISGRNRGKIDRLHACVRAGLHVLCDKPWILEEEELPRLRETLDAADTGRVVVYDAMTQRFEISAILQRALVNDPEVFGTPLRGTTDQPSVTSTSLHYLLKEVDGVPNRRPTWFFDPAEQGEGLTDVGTHLVDLVSWILFPEEAIDVRQDLAVLDGRRWPTRLNLEEFQRVTGQKTYPAALAGSVHDGFLEYYCNNAVHYTLRGVQVQLQTTWEFAPPPGAKDTELVVFRGSRARVELRQDPEDLYRREVVVIPNADVPEEDVVRGVRQRIDRLQAEWPGLAVETLNHRIRIVIPDRYRASHEEHFAAVAQRFLEYVRNPAALPAWEKPNLLAKYAVTTRGVALARRQPGQL